MFLYRRVCSTKRSKPAAAKNSSTSDADAAPVLAGRVTRGSRTAAAAGGAQVEEDDDDVIAKGPAKRSRAVAGKAKK